MSDYWSQAGNDFFILKIGVGIDFVYGLSFQLVASLFHSIKIWKSNSKSGQLIQDIFRVYMDNYRMSPDLGFRFQIKLVKIFKPSGIPALKKGKSGPHFGYLQSTLRQYNKPWQLLLSPVSIKISSSCWVCYQRIVLAYSYSIGTCNQTKSDSIYWFIAWFEEK